MNKFSLYIYVESNGVQAARDIHVKLQFFYSVESSSTLFTLLLLVCHIVQGTFLFNFAVLRVRRPSETYKKYTSSFCRLCLNYTGPRTFQPWTSRPWIFRPEPARSSAIGYFGQNQLGQKPIWPRTWANFKND